jgi:hypothetical protein
MFFNAIWKLTKYIRIFIKETDIGLNIELRIGMDLDIGTELNADTEFTILVQHSNPFSEERKLADCYTGDNWTCYVVLFVFVYWSRRESNMCT